MTDLEKFQEDVESLLKDGGFDIFPYQKGNFSEFVSDFEWSDTNNWKEFFTIAKKEGITTIFENVRRFSADDLESFKNDSEDDDDDLFEDICVEFESNLDEINSISFSWIKNNIRHTIAKRSSGLDELLKKIQELKKQKQVKQFEQRRPSYEERVEEDVPEKFIGKEEEIAKQFLEYIEIEHSDADRSELWNIKRAYWESIGINNYSNKQRIFTNKVSTIADRILSQKEREIIPDLVEKCVEWAIENNMDKPTQAILRGFLAEDNTNLSSNNFKILHTKVTLELKNSK